MVDPRLTGSSFMFFLWQPCAITFEDGVIALGKRVGLEENWVWRFLGYIWTTAWFTYSTPRFVDWAVAAGLGRHLLFRGTVARPVLQYVTEKMGVDVLGWVATKCAP